MQNKAGNLEQKIRQLESEMEKKISELTRIEAAKIEIDVEMITLQRKYNRMKIHTTVLEMDLEKQKAVEAENVQLKSENTRLRREVEELKLKYETSTVKSFITMEHDDVGSIIRS